jgi:hypothetical protein
VAGDDLEQCRLASAVAANQADALAFIERTGGRIEQRREPVGQFGPK